MNPLRVWAIARKETLQILRDKRSLILAFLLPVVLIFLFSAAITLDIRSIPAVIIDYSKSTHSRELIKRFTSSGYFRAIERTEDEARLTELLDRSQAKVGIVIPADFAAKLLEGGAVIQTIADGADANSAQSVLAYTTMIVSEYNLERLRSSLGSQISLPTIAYSPRFWYNADLDSQNFLVPGLISLVMTILASMLTCLTIAREWERGTMELLISTPVRPFELAVGKLAPYFLIGLFDTIVAAYVGIVVFDVPFNGSLLLLIALSSLFLLASLSFGYFISVIAKSQQLAYQISMLTSFLPGFLMSGFLFPISSMPLPLQVVSLLIPARYFIEALRGLFLKGNGPTVLYPQALALLAFAVVFSLIAARRFKRKIA